MGWGVSRTHEVLVMVNVTNHWTKVLILLTEDFVTEGRNQKYFLEGRNQKYILKGRNQKYILKGRNKSISWRVETKSISWRVETKSISWRVETKRKNLYKGSGSFQWCFLL